MDKLFQLILAVILALFFILFARAKGPRRDRSIYSIGLVVAAFFYVAFSVSDAGAKWFMIKFIGLVVFTLIAVLGLRVSLWFLAPEEKHGSTSSAKVSLIFPLVPSVPPYLALLVASVTCRTYLGTRSVRTWSFRATVEAFRGKSRSFLNALFLSLHQVVTC